MASTDQVSVGDRLDRIDDRLESVDRHLERLVELQERRDRREERVTEVELAERTARGAWIRSLISRETIIRGLILLAGAAGTAGLLGFQNP